MEKLNYSYFQQHMSSLLLQTGSTIVNTTQDAHTTNISQVFPNTSTNNQYYTVTEQIFIYLAGSLLSIITISGNVLVGLAYHKNKRLRTITNLFIFSLSISDIAVGVFSINLYTMYIVLKRWPLGVVVCDIWLCLDYVCCQASVINLLIICIDRYYSVTSPLTYRVKRTSGRAKIAIFVAWFIAFLQWAPWIVSYPYLKGERTVSSEACYVQFIYENWYASILTAMAAYYVPVFIMGGVYIQIYRLVKKREKELACLTISLKHTTGDNRDPMVDISNSPMVDVTKRKRFCTYDVPPGKEEKNGKNSAFSKISVLLKQKKAAKMLSIIFLAFAITWLPYHILVVWAPFCPTCIPTIWWDFSYMLCYLNSTINPLCYSLFNSEFRITFKKLLCKKEMRSGSKRVNVIKVKERNIQTPGLHNEAYESEHGNVNSDISTPSSNLDIDLDVMQRTQRSVTTICLVK